ncbi:MAG: alpha/beta hydrolase [Streptosporangiales bacterium]|nr:alpha/beta hydrolase [Streptosporangiales bacterium]MBO0891452.1 alpha/beta hydrolase [Acidothermales bacterium]
MSRPRSVELPPTVRRTSLLTGRGEFAAIRADPADGSDRAPALLVPGYSGSKEDFLALLEPIARAGRPVLAVDQRGQYDTPGPVAPAAYTTEALGHDVCAMVDELARDGAVHLLGHSFGGLVTRSAVLESTAGVASFTLLASGPARVVGVRQRHARLLVEVVSRFGPSVVATTMQRFEALRPGPKPSEEIAAFLRRRYETSSPHALVAMARAVLTEPDRVDELAGAPVPKLVAYGEDDDTWPPAVQAAMAERLGARHAVFPGAGHSPNVDTPAELAATLVAFWDEADAVASASEALADEEAAS